VTASVVPDMKCAGEATINAVSPHLSTATYITKGNEQDFADMLAHQTDSSSQPAPDRSLKGKIQEGEDLNLGAGKGESAGLVRPAYSPVLSVKIAENKKEQRIVTTLIINDPDQINVDRVGKDDLTVKKTGIIKKDKKDHSNTVDKTSSTLVAEYYTNLAYISGHCPLKNPQHSTAKISGSVLGSAFPEDSATVSINDVMSSVTVRQKDASAVGASTVFQGARPDENSKQQSRFIDKEILVGESTPNQCSGEKSTTNDVRSGMLNSGSFSRNNTLAESGQNMGSEVLSENEKPLEKVDDNQALNHSAVALLDGNASVNAVPEVRQSTMISDVDVSVRNKSEILQAENSSETVRKTAKLSASNKLSTANVDGISHSLEIPSDPKFVIGTTVATVEPSSRISLSGTSLHSENVAAGGAFAGMDAAVGVGHPSEISLGQAPAVGAHSLEVGISDSSHGWLQVRADMESSGAVAASLWASSPGAEQALRNSIADISSYLTQQQISVSKLTVHVVPSAPEGQNMTQYSASQSLGTNTQSGMQQQNAPHTPHHFQQPEENRGALKLQGSIAIASHEVVMEEAIDKRLSIRA
jgi:hypothetical protein